MHEYDLIADWYAAQRGDSTGVPEVSALARSIPRGSRVLDIGCGTGVPLTRTLADAGHRVVGIDSSQHMLAHFRRNCPAAAPVRAMVQSLPLRDGTFHAAVAWGILFHLTQAEQADAIASIARVLMRGATFLFTSGDVDGNRDDVVGTMRGVTFHYYSYSVEGYRRVLAERGLTLESVHADAGKNTYYSSVRSHFGAESAQTDEKA